MSGREPTSRAVQATLLGESAHLSDVLREAFAEALGVKQVALDDHFFQLGGHSLLVMRATARIEARLGVQLPVSLIFEQPTARALAARLATLDVNVGPTTTSPPASENEPSPLPPLQRGMWFLDHRVGRHEAYLLPDAWTLRGPLDAAALGRALHTLIARHAALSTRYTLVDGAPRQSVAEAGPFETTEHDLMHVEPAAREATVSALIAAEANKPFDLEHDTLLRASLLRLADDEHVLLLTVHHLAADAWSQHVLRRELAELYRESRDGVSRPAAGPPVERDDAVRRMRQVSDGRREELRAYWRRQLEKLPLLDLPVDRRRSTSWSDAGGELLVQIDPALTSRLEALASTCNVTLQMLLLAACQVLLGRYSGQEDFGIASFVSDRTADAFDAVGLFVNTIVLRADLTTAPTFRRLLARVRQTSLDGYDHRDLPFDALVAELRPDRQAGPHPLTGVAFQYLPMADAPPAFAGLEVSRLPCPTARVRFDIEFTVRKEGDGLRMLVGFSRDLWDHATIARLAGHYHTLLHGVVATPDASVAELSCLTGTERDEQLVSWSGLAGLRGRRGTVHNLFTSIATVWADRIALECGDERVTYGELNGRADRVASRLRVAGIGRGDVVAVHAGSSIALVEAMLGVLKAGAAYMPLDDTLPIERLTFMLRHARAAAVLTSSDPGWLADAVACVIELSATSDAAATLIPGVDPLPNTADDPAYVMFTSGSTGQPKGVKVAHRGITRLVLDAHYVAFQADDVVALASNPAFDAATFEIWGALLNGARLVEIDRHTLLSPRTLADAVERHGVTVMFLTAALFHQLAALAPDTFARLRCLIAGGDVVDPVAAAAVLSAAPPGRLVNGYGPTENTTFSATFRITPGLPIDRSIPIGRPIAGSTCYVLDPRMALLPVGAVGELHVGGSGLALGYVNDDALTAERFVEHPFLEGERLYKTGDLVRWRWDGQLEFLGRADRQVKLRGHRIELEEIEHVLSLHDAVSASAVMLDNTDRSGPRLLAYFSARSEPGPTPRTLAIHLKQRLPAYMVPAAFIELPSLPLTVNGKIDRAALGAVRPREESGDAAAPDTGDAGATHMVSLVGRAVRHVLQLERVHSSDNFFDLGGDSFSSIRLAGELASATGRLVAVTDVFSHPTIAELAIMLTRPNATSLPATLVEVRRGGARTPIYFPPGALGEVVVDAAIRDALPEDVPLYAFRAPLDEVLRAVSMEAMASRLCADLTTFQPDGPVSLAGYSFGGLLAFEMARQLKASGREIELLAIFDTGPDLSAGGGVRHTLTRIGLCLRNIPMWILEDLILSFGKQTPGRLWRSIKKQVRGTRSAAPGVVPRVDHLFDVTSWSPALYAHVDNNLKILGAFRYQPYDGDIVLFRARARPLFHAQTWDLGWQSLARSVRVISTPGNHHTLMLEPNIRVVARSLRTVLDGAGSIS